jgi:hypothetical protein
MPDVVTVGPPATDQQLVAALMMGGFSNNNAIATMVQIAGWESDKTPKINSSPGESPAGYSGCKSVGVWQINYCPGRDKGTIREQVANNPTDLVLSARAAYLVSNGGTNFHPWTTWVEHNTGTNLTPSSGTIPIIQSDTSPILGHVTNDPASLKAAGITSTVNDPCGARPTGATLSIFPWMICKMQSDLVRAGEILIGLILVIVALAIFGKIAGDKTGVTEIAKGAAIAAA